MWVTEFQALGPLAAVSQTHLAGIWMGSKEATTQLQYGMFQMAAYVP